MEKAYARIIRNKTIGGALLGGLYGGTGGLVRAAAYNKRKGLRKKDKRSVLGYGLAGLTIGAALGGKLGNMAAKDQVRTHKIYEDAFGNGRFYRGFNNASKKHPPDLHQHLGFLGVSKNAKTKKEVTQKYRDLAMKHHPDRGGDSQKMKDVNEAFDTIKKSDWFDKLGFALGFSKIHNF